MSLASYIGTNVAIPINPHIYDEDFDEIFWIGRCFADQDEVEFVRTTHFSTTYAYEISSNWGIETQFNYAPKHETLSKLSSLLNCLKDYMKPGDYFQLYSCWVGEEDEQSEGQMTVRMRDFNLKNINIPEKTVVTFQY
jgi:hypothetical protein